MSEPRDGAPESDLARAVAANEPVHDVTRHDHAWLLVVALVPFLAATVWFAQNH